MDRINKLILPSALIIVSLILGVFFYASQVNKQKSIEKQQEVSNALEDLKLKQDECKTLSLGVVKKWSNVIGVTYDNESLFIKECVVTYTDTKTGEIKTTPLRFMQTTK